MTEAQKLQYHLTNLLLADKLAVVYGTQRHAAIIRWARRVQQVCGDPKMQGLTGKILSTTPSKVVTMVAHLEENLISEGLYNDEYVS